MIIFNGILLFITVAYGFAFGIRNIAYRLTNILPGWSYKQSEWGKALDGVFVTSILYFYFIVDTGLLIETLKTLK